MAVRKTLRVILTGMISVWFVACQDTTTEKDIQVAMTYVAETQAVTSPAPAPTLTPPSQPSATPKLTFTPKPTTEIVLPESEIRWQDAGFFYRERITVCGPVGGPHYASDSKGQPTFLNLGEDYHSTNRFVVVIWGENRAQFPDDFEDAYFGETICCVTGEVEEYQGLYQMAVEDPADLLVK